MRDYRASSSRNERAIADDLYIFFLRMISSHWTFTVRRALNKSDIKELRLKASTRTNIIQGVVLELPTCMQQPQTTAMGK
jgi:hypothetical protein